jgi:hypothetical protein
MPYQRCIIWSVSAATGEYAHLEKGTDIFGASRAPSATPEFHVHEDLDSVAALRNKPTIADAIEHSGKSAFHLFSPRPHAEPVDIDMKG